MPIKHSIFVMLCVAVLAIGGFCTQAYADAAGDIGRTAISGGVVCPDAGSGVSKRIVTCIKAATQEVTDKYLISLYAAAGPYIAGITTLAVVIFGVLIATGAYNKPAAPTFILLLKIVFVGYFTADFSEWYHKFMGAMDELLAMVSTSAAASHTLDCSLSAGTAGQDKVWGMFDCAIYKLVGAGKHAVSNVGTLGAAALISMLFSAKEGLYIFFLVMGIIITLVMSVARSLYIFINAYVAISFLSALAPLMVPLVFFQQTKPRFDAWVKMLAGLILQPIFLVAYLAMILSAVDVVLYTGENSVYRTIAGDAALQPDFDLNKYLRDGNYYRTDALLEMLLLTNPWKAPDDKPEAKDTGSFGWTAMYKKIQEGGEWVKDKAKIAAVKAASLVFDIKIENIDIKKLAEARGISQPQEMIYKLLITMGTGMMMGFVFQNLLGYIPQLASELTGGQYGSSPILSNLGPMLGERAFQGLTQMATGLAKSAGGRFS